jgi:hypothetical protein
MIHRASNCTSDRARPRERRDFALTAYANHATSIVSRRDDV